MTTHPATRLSEDGARWLREHRDQIELHRLPPYSPEFMKFTTHNTFFVTPDQRDARLTATFNTFQRRPALIAAHVPRFH